MERPKLTKKHATFDSSSIQCQTSLNEQNHYGDQTIIDATTSKLPPIFDDPTTTTLNAINTNPPYLQNKSTNDHNLKRRPPIPPKSNHHHHHNIPSTTSTSSYLPPSTTNQTVINNKTTKPMDIDNHNDVVVTDDVGYDDENDNDNFNELYQNHDHTQRLSKLTLSSSLHLINDSKFINQQQPLQSTSSSQNHTSNNITDNNAQTKQNEMINSGKLNNNKNIKPNGKLLSQLNSEPSPGGLNKFPPNNHDNHNSKSQTNQQPFNANKKLEANLDTVHVVVGNEACDLDSAVSCLLFFHIISKISDEINGKDKSRTLYIPLLNTTREMLDGKSEVLWFLQKTLNIDKSFLTCKDDIDWAEIKKNGIEVLITLVDHNYNEEFNEIGRIVEIIDHHQVQNAEWLMQNHQNIRLTLDTSVGSCTTLIAERLFYIYAEHHVADEILLLIYGTILLDTVCLSEKAKRFTRRDVYLLRKLDALLGPRKPNRDELYKQLVGAKNSTRELNFERLMKRDLKIYKDKHGLRIGIASLFGMAAKEALGLAVNVDLDQFFCQNKYEAFIIMGLIADLDQSDGISRDLVLISANDQLFEALCGVFEQDSNKLDLEIIGGPRTGSTDPEDIDLLTSCIAKLTDASKRAGSSAGNFLTPLPALKEPQQTSDGLEYRTRIWIQRNVTSSRKVIAPLVLKVLHDGAWK